MISHKILFLFIIVMFMSHLAVAQSNINVVGTVFDENNMPVDLALVALKTQTDSLIKTVYTDQDGSYTLGAIIPGKYVLQTNMLGYEMKNQAIDLSIGKEVFVIDKIILIASPQSLANVTVTSKVPYVERKIDKTVINVDALIANAGSNALEALERAPGITLDQNGVIKLKGKAGVAVYIDDKPTYVSGTELENYLKSLPAGSIKQIEIMDNPPAKYEAAGNAGVINIITKRSKASGFHGNAIASLQQGRYTRSNNSVNLNYNKNKIGLYANINGGFRNSFQDLNINRFYKNDQQVRTSSFAQNSFIVKDGQSANAKLGLDYYMTDKTTVGFSAKGLLSLSGDQTDNTAFVRDAQGTTTSRVNADNDTDNTFDNGTFNVYAKRQLDTLGSSISMDADYVQYNSGSNQVFKNTIYNAANALIYSDLINGEIPSDIKIYAAKVDYTRPIGKTTKWEAGLKSAFTETDNEAIYSTTIDGVTTPDYGLSNTFLYDEWIHAAYVNYSQSLGKLSLQLGLRGESTQLKGNQLGNVIQPDTSFTRKYANLFPTFYASYPLDSFDNHVLSLSYGRRIDRPFFQDLNPFVSPLDKFTFYAGNPGLLPTFSQNYSITHTFKNKINTSINYSKTTDGINETLEIKNGIYYSRPGNISTNYTTSLSVDAAVTLTPWYTVNAYAELGHQRYTSALYTEQLDASGTFYALSATQSFVLGSGWNADVRADYQSDIVYAQLLIKSFGTLNAAVQKKLMKDKASIKLSLNDILYTRRADGIINNLRNTDADWNSRLDTRSVTVAFSYRFGKSASNKPKHTTTGSDTEQKRVKG